MENNPGLRGWSYCNPRNLYCWKEATGEAEVLIPKTEVIATRLFVRDHKSREPDRS